MRSATYLVGLLSIVYPLTRVYAAPTPEFSVFEKLNAVPQGWHEAGAVPASKQLRFRIAVKLQNAYDFEQHVIDISTPDHPKYGEHMSREELKRALRPSSDATNAIVSWLEAEGVPAADIEDDGDWINFSAQASDAERILDTKFKYYTSSYNKVTRIRTLQYSVPENVRQYVQMIQPTTRFGQMQAERSTVFKTGDGVPLPEKLVRQQTVAASCNTTITPDCLRDLYNIGNATASPNSGNKLGVSGYLKEYAKFNALAQFLTMFTDQDPAVNNFTYTLINGGLMTQNDTVDDDVEANLDVQYAMSLAFLTPTTFYSTGGLGLLVPDNDEPTQADDQNEPYLDFLHFILALPDDELPKTLTTSYGEDEQSVPEFYTNATCNLFAQLGARGVSIIFSSGDTGVGSACETNDGKNTTRFNPVFPAACPFVTSVGGTIHIEPEQAVSFSSGGFSDRFPRPSYQDAAVTAYLDILGTQWEGLFNPNGRGFPDVAAQAEGFSVVDNGRVISVGGTSCAAPTFAGVVSLLNDARLCAGKKPLGFLNPFIYSKGFKGLTDIVNGGSRGCTGRDIFTGAPVPVVPFASWNATTGWDPVTGFGTPNFPVLKALALEE